MILAQNWPKTVKSSWQCPFKMSSIVTPKSEALYDSLEGMSFSWSTSDRSHGEKISSFTQPSSFTFATKFETDFSGLPWRNRLDVLREKMRWSCGAGLVFLLGIARVELNYCVPFRAQNSDRYHFVNLVTSLVSSRKKLLHHAVKLPFFSISYASTEHSVFLRINISWWTDVLVLWFFFPFFSV